MLQQLDRTNAPSCPRVSCLSFKRFHSNTLLGFCDFHVVPYRLKVFGCALHEHANGRRAVQLPARAQLSPQRELIRDQRGKVQYSPFLKWDDEIIADAWSAAAVEALLLYDPSAFDSGER